MNKAELVAAVAAEVGMTKKDAAAVIDATFNAIAEHLAEGGRVRLAGFGSFEVHERAARETLNPQTKGRVLIPASRAPVFKPAKELKDAVRQEKE